MDGFDGLRKETRGNACATGICRVLRRHLRQRVSVRKTPQEAGALAGKYKSDRQLLRARINAGLEALRLQPLVDQKRVAAIGYCFGGTTVIELARSGADVAGVVSFHGGLDSPTRRTAKTSSARCWCAMARMIRSSSPEDIAAFENEMRNGGRGLAAHQIWRRRPCLYPAKRGQRQFQRRGLQRKGGQTLVGSHDAILRRDFQIETDSNRFSHTGDFVAILTRSRWPRNALPRTVSLLPS